MPNPTVTIDISSVEARRGREGVVRELDTIRASVALAERQVASLNASLASMGRTPGGRGAGQGFAAELAKQEQAVRSLVATQQQARSQERALEADRARAIREQSRLDAERLRARQRGERAALTALSTLGGENRALSQRIQFERRLTEAVKSGVIQQQRANQLRQRANEVFSTGSVNARDLRRNMAGINERLRDLSNTATLALGPLSGIGSRFIAINSLAQNTNFRIAGLVAGLIGVGGLVAAAIRTAKSLDDIGKQADQTGVSIEELQALRFVGLRQGVDNADRAIETFVKRLGEAKQGSGEAGPAIESLGLSIEQLRDERPIDALRQIADAFEKVEDPAERGAIASDLFSRANLRMVNVLGLGSSGIDALIERAERLGLIFDEQTVRQAERTNDRLTEMGLVSTTAGQRMVANLIPAIESVADASLRAGINISDFLNRLSDDRTIGSLRSQIGLLENELSNLLTEQERPDFFTQFFVGPFGESIDERIEQIAARLIELNAQLRELEGIEGPSGDGIASLSEAGEKAGESIDDLVQAVSDLRAQSEAIEGGGLAALFATQDLQQAQEIIRDLSDDDLALLAKQLERAGVAGDTLEEKVANLVEEERNLKDAIRDSTDEIDEQRRAAEKHAKAVEKIEESIAKTTRQRESSIDLLRREIEATRQGEEALRDFQIEKAGDLAVERALEEAKRAKVKLTEEQIRRTRELAEEEARLKGVLEETRDATGDVFGDLGDDLKSIFRGTFRDILTDGEDAFKDFADRIEKIFIDLALKIAEKLIFDAVINVTGVGVPGGGPGGSFVLSPQSGLLGQLGGIIASPGPTSPRAPGQTPPTFPTPGGGTQTTPLGTLILATGGSALGAQLAGSSTEGPIGQGLGGLGAVVGGIAGFELLGPVGAFLGAAGLGFIGAEIGGLLDNLFGLTGTRSSDKPKIAPLSVVDLSPNVPGLTAEDFARAGAGGGAGFEGGIFGESPFGFVGLARSSRRLSDEFIQGFADLFVSIDETLAQFLSESEIERIARELEGGLQSHRSSGIDEELVFFVNERVWDILRSVLGDRAESVIEELKQFSIDVTGGATQAEIDEAIQGILKTAAEVLAERAALIESLENQINPVMLTEVEQALAALANEFGAVRLEAERLNVSLDLVADAEAAARENLATGFAESVENQILQLTDSAAFQRMQLGLDQERRLAEARALIDEGLLSEDFLARVRELNALERENLELQLAAAETQNESLQLAAAETQNESLRLAPVESFLEGLLAGPQSPLAPDVVLENARSLFRTTASAALRGDQEAIVAFPSAANAFLAASENMFASTERFFQDFNVVAGLSERILGTSSDALIGSATGVIGNVIASVGLSNLDAGISEVARHTSESVEVQERQLAAIERMEERIEQLEATIARQQAELQRLAVAAS